MDESLSRARYSHLTWNAPLSESHADQLLDDLHLSPTDCVVDLGCGWGELLLRAVAKSRARGIGVDIDVAALHLGTAAAQERCLDAKFIELSADQWDENAERAICIGSSHAFGGSQDMLRRLAEIIPQGRVLVGDMCWERPPTEEARKLFGEEIPQLSDMVTMCRDTGWQVLRLSTADQREWDEFESKHRAGLREWIIANPEDPRAEEIGDQQAVREQDYLVKYRGILSFVYLVIAR
ncbi:putative SAM-dependent methyltransferase [Dactylonectria estremocensis]|uniref:SAM-dependent methyltransferase n=1 Tax=Dactylonectria estremocensis TaxID=1079267 RepID=A0A9P9E6N3_9HYPO|nr:putative SAM-dependent methyltransferase [Dactylonectria estremocensis]